MTESKFVYWWGLDQRTAPGGKENQYPSRGVINRKCHPFNRLTAQQNALIRSENKFLNFRKTFMGAIIFVVYLGAMVGIALALFFGLRAAKII